MLPIMYKLHRMDERWSDSHTVVVETLIQLMSDSHTVVMAPVTEARND